MSSVLKPRISIGGWLVASAVAPALASAISIMLLFAGETVPWLFHLSGASQTEKALFGFQSLWSELGQSSVELVVSILLSPVVVPLGFVGACVFLLPAFALVEIRPTAVRFIAAGSFAGVMHAATGIAIAPLTGPIGGLSIILGYLPYAIRFPATVAFGMGAVIAGAVSGWVYWRLLAVVPSLHEASDLASGN